MKPRKSGESEPTTNAHIAIRPTAVDLYRLSITSNTEACVFASKKPRATP